MLLLHEGKFYDMAQSCGSEFMYIEKCLEGSMFSEMWLPQMLVLWVVKF